MQTAKFINPRRQEILFAYEPPYIFESIDGISAVDAQYNTGASPGQDGKTAYEVTLTDREVTLTFHVKGKDRAGMYRSRQQLIALLSPQMYQNGVLGRLEYANDYGRWWIPASVKIGPVPDKRIRNYNHCKVVFYCPNPYFRPFTPQIGSLAYLDGGLEFPLELDAENQVEFGMRGYRNSVYNFGDSACPAYIKITGPATEPQVTKISSGEYIRIRRPLAQGDTLTIGTEPHNFDATIRRASGETEDATGYLDLTSNPFTLDPGENVLEYNSGDDTTTARVTVESYGWYGGV